MTKNINKIYLNLAKKLAIYLTLAGLIFGIFSPISSVLAQTQEPLTISNVQVIKQDQSATITWVSNRAAFGKIQWGIVPGDYKWTLQTGQKKTVQSITIFGLFPDTNYYFRITANDDSSEVISFEQNFKTTKFSDNKAPLISNVSVPYTTGHTATIQWITDEPATSEVEYGLTTKYGAVRADGNLVTVHDITLTGLTDATTYQFLVKSKDKDNNITKYYNLSFRTTFGSKLETDDLIIYDIKPSAQNDLEVSNTTAIITWRTNKLAEGWVRYATSPNAGPSIHTNAPRDFQKSITLTNLNPNTTYYFDILVKDVLGKQVRTEPKSFTTRPSTGTTSSGTSSGSSGGSSSGQVLGTKFYSATSPTADQLVGSRSCNINLNTQYGWSGYYYNQSEDHPEMQLPVSYTWSKVGRENDWYDAKYFVEEKIDKNLLFRGSSFFPLNQGLKGDPSHFSVNWRAIMEVPQDGNYSYSIGSDDDSWLFIDDVLENNFGSISPHPEISKTVYLTAGYHKIEIFYADRRKSGAFFVFDPNAQLKFHPLPLGCEVTDVVNYGGAGGSGSQTPVTDTGNGQVLGVKDTTPAYACNPNLGYTKIKALYKTTASPDIWALLETGQKHYITSPESFNLYECDWSKVQTVSQKFLDGFANATLVKTPTNATVYHLFDRPLTKWLKINIPSPTVFVSYSKNFWGNIARINHLDLASYPDVRFIKGETNATVYLIEGSNKKPFTSQEQFTKLGHDWIEVATLNQPHLDSYLTIGPVE